MFAASIGRFCSFLAAALLDFEPLYPPSFHLS